MTELDAAKSGHRAHEGAYLKTTIDAVQSTVARVQQNTITHQQVAILSQETNQVVKEAAELRITTTALLQEKNDIAKPKNDITRATDDIAKAIQTTPTSTGSYASVFSSNVTPLSKPSTISTQTSLFIKAQREIIVKIADLSTIEALRAENPRNRLLVPCPHE